VIVRVAQTLGEQLADPHDLLTLYRVWLAPEIAECVEAEAAARREGDGYQWDAETVVRKVLEDWVLRLEHERKDGRARRDHAERPQGVVVPDRIVVRANRSGKVTEWNPMVLWKWWIPVRLVNNLKAEGKRLGCTAEQALCTLLAERYKR